MREELGGSVFVVEPCEYGLEWVQPAIERQHDIRRSRLAIVHSHVSESAEM